MIHTFTWVKNNIQPILNNLGGEIFGGLARDYFSGKDSFNDVDINYPHSYSEDNVNIFISELRKLNLSHHISWTTSTISGYDTKITSFSRTKIKLENPYRQSNNELKIDLVWDHRGDNQLDVDLHALYLTPNWDMGVYPQLQYRFADFNIKRKQFIALEAPRYRIDKLVPKWKQLESYGKLVNRNIDLVGLIEPIAASRSTDGRDRGGDPFDEEFVKKIPESTPGLWELRYPLTCPADSLRGGLIEGWISPVQKTNLGQAIYRALYSKQHSNRDEKIFLEIGDKKILPSSAFFANNKEWVYRECLVPKGVGMANAVKDASKLDMMQHDVYFVMEHPEGWS